MMADGPRERRRVDMAAEIMGDEEQAIAYLHSAFTLAMLPHRKPENDNEPWIRSNGRFALTVAPSIFATPDGTRHLVGVPYGTRARLILIYLQTEAVRTRARTIDMGGSMSNWMHGLGLAVTGGKTGSISAVKDQVARVARCKFTMAWEGDNGGIWLDDARLVEGASLWFPRDGRQGVLWPSYIELAQSFFDNLLTHAVPLDETAIRALKGSSLALDLYVWLAHRLPRIKVPAMVSWEALQHQFGSDYRRRRDFAAKVHETLKDVLAVYRDARVEDRDGGLMLRHSKPPIARRNRVIEGKGS